MISIILPFYQSEKYLSTAIESVLNQSYQRWELLLINDGSTDQSKSIALSFHDPRIRYFEQSNKGVSTARNVGLANMKGNYFCLLDADDALPKHSLEKRIAMFSSNAAIDFVDGTVHKMDERLEKLKQKWSPDFFGNPLKDLVKLKGRSFFGPSWLVKRKPGITYRLQEGLTHAEDLLFYLELSRKGGQYAYTTEPILYYRDSPGSAMKNLNGLEKGYRYIDSQLKHWMEVSRIDLLTYRFKFRKAMFLAYLEIGNFKDAIRVWK